MTTSAGRRDRVASALCGMRRADCVKMVEGVKPRFFVVGVGHRLPMEREISPSVANELLRRLPLRYELPRGRREAV